jgi:hypothetical protein
MTRAVIWIDGIRLSLVLAAIASGLALAPATRAAAQAAAAETPPPPTEPSPEMEELRRALRREPSARRTVEAGLRHFRVHPEVVDGLRAAARGRGAVPLIAGGYRYDLSDTDRDFAQQMFQPNTQDETTGLRGHSVTAGAIWDLREMVFNPAELQAYGVVGVQRDLILELTRTYFMRRQLVIRLRLRPPADEVARFSLETRVEELTAILDTMTGGWFGEELMASVRD